jgi:bis(5'-nucleosyl)-tetraphosphatase (symmetrical)
MATYAIGDVQGCFQALRALLEQIAFNPKRDRLWFVGDLVNRGPDSLATLRFVKGLGNSAVCVLGNHDLHLVAVAEGHAVLRRDDTLDETLSAPDCAELVAWLRQRPLMHAEGGCAMVHAGLLPSWTITQAQELAREVESALRAPNYTSVLSRMYGNEPDRWSNRLTGYARLRVIVNAMTRMRVCTREGVMQLRYKGDTTVLPADILPWFAVPGRASSTTPVIFGHWSALGLVLEPNVIGLDTGCLWGRKLSAFRLEDRQLFQFSCRDAASPKRRR